MHVQILVAQKWYRQPILEQIIYKLSTKQENLKQNYLSKNTLFVRSSDYEVNYYWYFWYCKLRSDTYNKKTLKHLH